MHDEWWERPVCFICDFWWAILLAILLGLAVFLTRGTWLPWLGINPAVTPAAISTPASTPAVVSTSAGTSTPGNSAITEFIDPQGTFTLTYPLDWPTSDAGNQAQQWVLPEGAVMSVHAEPMQPGDTLDSYAQEVVTRLPYDVIAQVPMQVGGQAAIRQEVTYPGQTQRVAVGYLVLYSGQKYQIALSGLDAITAGDQTRVIQEFEQVLTTFQFQP